MNYQSDDERIEASIREVEDVLTEDEKAILRRSGIHVYKRLASDDPEEVKSAMRELLKLLITGGS